MPASLFFFLFIIFPSQFLMIGDQVASNAMDFFFTTHKQPSYGLDESAPALGSLRGSFPQFVVQGALTAVSKHYETEDPLLFHTLFSPPLILLVLVSPDFIRPLQPTSGTKYVPLFLCL